MRLVSTKDCRPGMRLGKPVFTDSGQILVNEKPEHFPRMLEQRQNARP